MGDTINPDFCTYLLKMKNGTFMTIQGNGLVTALCDNGLTLDWFDDNVIEWDFVTV